MSISHENAHSSRRKVKYILYYCYYFESSEYHKVSPKQVQQLYCVCLQYHFYHNLHLNFEQQLSTLFRHLIKCFVFQRVLTLVDFLLKFFHVRFCTYKF